MLAAKPISVMIVDDHRIVRIGIAIFLTAFDDLILVAEAANGADAIHQCQSIQPDVILMDIHMPELDGLAATRVIRKRFPQIKIILLSNLIDQTAFDNALAAGAVRCMSKSVEGRELADAIRAANALPIAA